MDTVVAGSTNITVAAYPTATRKYDTIVLIKGDRDYDVVMIPPTAIGLKHKSIKYSIAIEVPSLLHSTRWLSPCQCLWRM